ncbi:polysaccharide deacetylase family protein [Luteococcus sp. H138]|uniref:polysaccharide deacetylase family protein n=1 Tax=unclassified Luteococcus TaxID=2639923 RepID=UPI00313E2968
MPHLPQRHPLLLIACLASAALSACGGPAEQSAPPAHQSTSTAATPAASPTPTATPRASRPSTTEKVDCKKLKCIALTYDDGPSPLTPKLLKAFTDRKATATLFMLGNAAETYPKTVKQAHEQGFEIANHTYDHQAISGLSDAKVAWEVSKTNTALTRITGVQPTLMRPPYAARTSRTDTVVGTHGLAVVVWHNSPEDWVAGHNTASVITKLTVQRASRNAILLMHDIHPWTVDAAAPTIDALQKQGYTLVTVSQLLGRTTPGKVYPAA